MRKKLKVDNDKEETLKNEIIHEIEQYVATQIQLSIVDYHFFSFIH